MRTPKMILKLALLGFLLNPPVWAGQNLCDLPGETRQICTACVDKLEPEDWKWLQKHLVDRAHREWHFEWHATFENPPLPTEGQLSRLKTLDLAKPEDNPQSFVQRQRNNAGESFFFMHRYMIQMVQSLLTQSGRPCISSWPTIPSSPLDPVWPVPTALAPDADLEILESAQRALRRYARPYEIAEYATSSPELHNVGMQLISSIHRGLHHIYEITDEDKLTRCQGDILNSKTCDSLEDDKSSQGNEYFWKFHGYLDRLIGPWMKSKGYTEIALDCEQRQGCYEWKGTYLTYDFPVVTMPLRHSPHKH